LLLSNSTQRGSILGNSFGVRLIDSKSMHDFILLILGLALGVIFYQKFPLKIDFTQFEIHDFTVLLTLMITYEALWFTGPHFAYRLLILIPVIGYLSKDNSEGMLISFIILVLLTVRLESSFILTTALFVIFLLNILNSYKEIKFVKLFQ
jgi:hypothetical protein